MAILNIGVAEISIASDNFLYKTFSAQKKEEQGSGWMFSCKRKTEQSELCSEVAKTGKKVHIRGNFKVRNSKSTPFRVRRVAHKFLCKVQNQENDIFKVRCLLCHQSKSSDCPKSCPNHGSALSTYPRFAWLSGTIISLKRHRKRRRFLSL